MLLYPVLIEIFTILLLLSLRLPVFQVSYGTFFSPRSGVGIKIVLYNFVTNILYFTYLWLIYPEINTFGELVYPSMNLGGVIFIADELSLIFTLLSSTVLLISFLASLHILKDLIGFGSILILMELCLLGSFTSTNLLCFLIFFEGVALPTYILLLLGGSNRKERFKAALMFIFFTIYGSTAILFVIVYTSAKLNFLSTESHEILEDIAGAKSLWVLLFIAFAAKIPLVPLHLWLPYAHVEASTPVSMILAGILLKLGGYGFIRYLLPTFTYELHLYFKPFLLFISIYSFLYGAIVSIRQIDLKKLIAFGSVSHMGLAMTGISTLTSAGLRGGIYLLLNHGITSVAFFYLIGILSERYHNRSIMIYSGLSGALPFYSFFLLVFTLFDFGFPGSGGFLSELLILYAISQTGFGLLLPVCAGCFFGTCAGLLLLFRMNTGSVKAGVSGSVWIDLTRLEFFILLLLSFSALALGLFFPLA